jgi:hypothetical protein
VPEADHERLFPFHQSPVTLRQFGAVLSKNTKRREKEKERRFQERLVVSNTEATSTPKPCDLYKSAFKLVSAILLMSALCNVTYWYGMGTVCWAQGQ